ncbi:unnamed protein product [Cryptosporidium hominis]|uniref:Uncharacterized protein n=2 Tax=Cryptosporidium hominis TaxID=237895 RepID=A0A0S4TDB0_CRYHO|nr:Uncharacterized protein GY17_00003556 [Cryptosporidium hominis]CUV04759.1 unnamed protein product [Cryptosporidium hominis]|eukprot:PPS94445.1 Uncharacterized protein GY17_00003556 [Cryptosporidium hominis]
MYGIKIFQAEKVLPICGIIARKNTRVLTKFAIPVINGEFNKRWFHINQNRELLSQNNSNSSLPLLLSIDKGKFYSDLDGNIKKNKLKDLLKNKYLGIINNNSNNNNRRNIKLGVSAGLISLFLYILSLVKERNENEKHIKSRFGPNIATKYIINVINDPKIEDSLKKLFKRVLTSLVKDDEFTKDWKIGIRHVIKECEDEIGENLTNVLKTKIVQDWLYSTTNEIVDYMSKAPDIISKTSSLFSDAFNHHIFTENSKKWLEEFIHNCVINNKKIIHSINHLLIRIFNTKDIQNNLSDLFKDVILNESTQDYISLAFWNVIRKSVIFPKNWFNGIKSTENPLKKLVNSKENSEK